MTLDETVKAFESKFEFVIDGGKAAIAPTGEPFIGIALLGYDLEKILEEWLGEANKLSGSSKVLYWRFRPEISTYFIRECDENGIPVVVPGVPDSDLVRKEFRLYSRLAIGDELPVHKIDEVTENCIACGATREWIASGRAPICVPDGKPHHRVTAKFDEVAA